MDRALVTENVKDFDRIARVGGARSHHAGVIFTSPRRFHRGSVAYPQNLIAGLKQLLAKPRADNRDWIHWLS